jgi:hypothetical protein
MRNRDAEGATTIILTNRFSESILVSSIMVFALFGLTWPAELTPGRVQPRTCLPYLRMGPNIIELARKRMWTFPVTLPLVIIRLACQILS